MEHRQLVSALAKRSSLTQKETGTIVQSIIQAATDVLAEGKSLAIPGFGTFMPQVVTEHVETYTEGRRFLIPPCIKMEFSAASHLLKSI